MKVVHVLILKTALGFFLLFLNNLVLQPVRELSKVGMHSCSGGGVGGLQWLGAELEPKQDKEGTHVGKAAVRV